MKQGHKTNKDTAGYDEMNDGDLSPPVLRSHSTGTRSAGMDTASASAVDVSEASYLREHQEFVNSKTVQVGDPAAGRLPQPMPLPEVVPTGRVLSLPGAYAVSPTNSGNNNYNNRARAGEEDNSNITLDNGRDPTTATTTESSGSTDTDDLYLLHQPPEPATTTTIAEAELVNEEEEEEARRQIERLQKQVEGLQNMQNLQQGEVVVVGVAEPLVYNAHSHTDNNNNNHKEANKGHSRLIRAPSEIALRGRDEEVALLRECLYHPPPQGRHWITIQGQSGVGKTRLAQSLRQAVEETKKGLFVQGKFDLHRQGGPHYGIVTACEEICQAIIQSSSRAYREMRGLLAVEFTDQDVRVLSKVIPTLVSIVNNDVNNDNATSKGSNLNNNTLETFEDQDAQETKARLRYLFRNFFRCVSLQFEPLVVCLDDLQWSEPASLELIEAIVTDSENPNITVLGLFRSNSNEGTTENAATEEKLKSHVLTSFLSDLRENHYQDSGLHVSEISLGNISFSASRAVLEDLLSHDGSEEDRFVGLAELCYKRTHGNVFFLISYVTMLEDEGLLCYEPEQSSFTWDLDKIRTGTSATSNIVDLLKTKMTKTTPELQLLLSLAAYLGSSFKVSIMDILWNQSDLSEKKLPGLSVTLSAAVEDGYFEFLKKTESYRWIHDKVQEAALQLISVSASVTFEYQVGSCLLQNLGSTDLDDNVFLVADLMKLSQTEALSNEERLQLAKLNLRATQEAIACSALSNAARYAAAGIKFLPEDSWSIHPSLTLHLYSFAAEASEVIGDHEAMHSFCKTVLEQDIPVHQQVRVYTVLASQMGNSGDNAKAVELLLGVLQQLGCSFPRSSLGLFFSTVTGLMKAKRTVKYRTLEEVDNMPIMTDPMQIQKMELIDKLITYAHVCKHGCGLLAILRSISLTLEHGLSELSPPAFGAVTSILSGIFEDFSAAKQLSEYSMRQAKKTGALKTLARTQFIVASFGLPWTQPFQSLPSLYLESYSDGMRGGDTESAMWVRFKSLYPC